MKTFEWADATSVDQAVQLTVKGSAFKAGGVDLVDLMKERLVRPTRIVNVATVADWNFIRDDAKAGLKIGPLATLAELSENDVVKKRYTALAEAAGHAATPQIRNMATIGGNLLQRPRCWYFRHEEFHCRKKGGEKCFAQDGENQYHAIFDNNLCAIVHPSATACALVAMGATIDLTNGKEKRTVALEKFFALPAEDVTRENRLKDAELITQINVPAPSANTRSFYIKQGEKESFDWPISEVAVVLEVEGGTCKKASVVLGAASPIPRRARETETALAGQKITDKLARSAAEAAMKDANPMTMNQYKVPLFKVIIARTILAAAGAKEA